MGINMNCQLVENDEELINNILKSFNLTEIDCTTAYKKYLTCLNSSSLRLNNEDYVRFVNAILGNSKYKEYQERYLISLREEFKDETIVGTMVVILSKGNKETKIGLLIDHYHLNSRQVDLKHFIKDIIKVNSIHCLNSFKDCIDKGNYHLFNNVYSEQRLDYLCRWIMNNYNEINTKYNSKNKESSNIEETNSIINNISSLNKIKSNDDNQVLKEFFESIYDQLDGEFIRNWLYEDFLKEKPKIKVPCD